MLHGIYIYSYMTNYIVHYMNNYKILHDILHGITCHYMEIVLVPTSRTRLRRQDLRSCASRLVAACMQGQAGVAEDSEYTALGDFK